LMNYITSEFFLWHAFTDDLYRYHQCSAEGGARPISISRIIAPNDWRPVWRQHRAIRGNRIDRRCRIGEGG
jgi:hypothetical protein